MSRGISFEIPNQYGSFLGEILKPLDVASFDWFIGGEESYFTDDSGLGKPLFPEMVLGMKGEHLKDIIENHKYYLIFANLKAFPKGKKVIDIMTYEDYFQSDCQFVILIVDSSYVTIYCKDPKLLLALHENAKNNGYSSLEYITDENDTRTALSVW